VAELPIRALAKVPRLKLLDAADEITAPPNAII
jgi:hypothetical protein